MTAGVLNYPRRVLSERESIIREATERISRLFGGAGATATVKILADQAGTSSTLADVTNLKFSVLNGLYYQFKFTCIIQSAAATCGVRLGLTVPAFTRYAATVRTLFAADGASATWSGSMTASGDSVLSTDLPAASTDYLAVIEGAIIPSADGTVQVQYANEDNSTSVRVRQGSCGTLAVV